MYKIYFYNNGVSTLFCDDSSLLDQYKLEDATLSLSDNAAGSLEFTVPQTNELYNRIPRMRGLIKVYKGTRLYWEGRVLSEDVDFWGNIKVYCEGILACFNDTRQPQHVYKDLPVRSYMEALLSIHNQKVEPDKRFLIGVVTANDNAPCGERITNFESTWDLLKKLVDEYKGHMFIRYDGEVRYLDYRKSPPRTSSQKIEFGVNLMDFTRSYDMSSLCTVLLPLGKVQASAGTSTIGDVINANVTSGYYIDPDDFNTYYDESLDGSYFGSSQYIAVEAGKTYYVTCRNHSGRVMWALKDAGGNLIQSHTASTGDGMTDLIESKIDIPQSDVGNAYYLAIAGFGYDISPRVNGYIEAQKGFDTYTTVESVNNGSLYVVNEAAVSAYGWIEQQLTWENIDNPSELLRLAQTYLRDGQFDEMTLDISAIDLQSIGVDTDRIDILDEVWAVSVPHGLNKVFPVTELKIKIGDPSGTEFTLGSKTEQTLSGVVSGANDEIFAKLKEVPSYSSIVESAKENATQIINTTLSGIFTLEQNEDSTNIGFRISNVPDWDAEGAKGWRFTMGGLGYFGNGFNRPVTIALTGEDGGIVANCITTGTMYADRIHGGTLTLGGYNNDNGIIQVRNADSLVTCLLDNNGFYTQNEFGLWMQLKDGTLFGGNNFGQKQLASIETNAIITDLDTGTDYVGLRITSDVVYLETSFFSINGHTGVTTQMEYGSNVNNEYSEEVFAVVESWDAESGTLHLNSNSGNVVSDSSMDTTIVDFNNGILTTRINIS